MQRSFSSSSADHHRSSTATCRHLPVRRVYNNISDYYSSDTDCQHQSYLQRASSTSSFSSASSIGSANYRILPVRYSSVDRVLPKITANERGINVRINFDRPHKHHHHHHHRQHSIEEYEHHHRKHMTKEHQHYDSCPVLDKNNSKSSLGGLSNITYIETRSIVRDGSKDRVNNKTKPPIATTRIKHIPFNPNCVSTRVIREEEE